MSKKTQDQIVEEYVKKIAPMLKMVGMDSASFKVMLERAEKELKEKKEHDDKKQRKTI